MRTHSWLTFGLVFTLVTAFPACRLVDNNRSTENLKGAEPVYNPLLPPASSASWLLGDPRFNDILIEIQSVNGMDPSQKAINHLESFIKKEIAKPDLKVKTVRSTPITISRRAAYTVSDARELEATFRKHYSKKNEIVIYYLFVDAPSADDDGNDYQTLGQAHLNTSIVIYEKTIRDLVAAKAAQATDEKKAKPKRWVAEAAIMEHELGHLLGLTNAGTDQVTPHEDPHNPGHCADTTCLMHYTTETTAFDVNRTEPPKLQDNCRNDLKNRMRKL